MDMKKRRDMQLLYVADEAIMEEQSVCRKKLQKLNFMDRSDFDGVAETVKDLFGKTGKDCTGVSRKGRNGLIHQRQTEAALRRTVETCRLG